MNDFWKSYDITHAEYGADYRCYPLYGTVHLVELAFSLAFIVGVVLWYCRSSARTRRVPQVLALLFGSALPIYFLNKPLNTNFYFLNNPYGNIITSTFTALLGEKYYILGFLPAIALALGIMYLPWAVVDHLAK